MESFKEIFKSYLAKLDIMKIIVGLFVMMVYFLIVRGLLDKALPVENRESIIHVLGTLDGVVSLLVGYYFGSSKGSQEKNDMIRKQTESANEKTNP